MMQSWLVWVLGSVQLFLQQLFLGDFLVILPQKCAMHIPKILDIVF